MGVIRDRRGRDGRSDRRQGQARPRPRRAAIGLTGVETLEGRIAPAYTSTLDPSLTVATMTGDAASDTLSFDVVGGLLHHNRASAGDPNFASDFDFDTTVAGEQTLAASFGNQVTITTLGGGDDVVNLGSATSPANDLIARFVLGSGGLGNDALNIDFGAAFLPVGLIYDDATGDIFTTDGGLNLFNNALLESGIQLTMSTFGDEVAVRSSSPGTPLNIEGNGGFDGVVLGRAGSTSDILAPVRIANATFLTDVVIDNQAATAAQAVTVAVNGGSPDESIVTGLTPAFIRFVQADVSQLFLFSGSGDDSFDITPGASTIAVNPGDGFNTAVVRAGSEAVTYRPTDGTRDVLVGTHQPVRLPIPTALTIDGGAGEFTVDSFSNTPETLELSRGPAGNEFTLDGSFPVEIGPGFTAFRYFANGVAPATFVINETADGLPLFSGVTSTGQINPAFTDSGLTPTEPNIRFNALGAGTLVLNTIAPREVAYFPDSLDTPNSGVLNVAGALTISFAGLAPIVLNGAGGTLTIDGTALPFLDTLDIGDDATPDDGKSIVTGNAGSGFEPVTFAGFDSLIVRAGGTAGFRSINLNALDALTSIADISLSGDNTTGTAVGDTIIQVNALNPGIALDLVGTAGNDFYNIGDFLTFSADNVAGPITVAADGPAGAPGTIDALLIFDGGSFFDKTITLTPTTIDGVLGTPGASPRITYNTGDPLEFVEVNRRSLFPLFDFISTTFDVRGTSAASSYRLTTSSGNDTFNISSDAPNNLGDLSTIQGPIEIAPGAGFDVLNVSDLADTANNAYGIGVDPAIPALTRLTFSNSATISYVINTAIPDDPDDLEQLFLTAGRGNNTYTIDDTTATIFTQFNDGDAAGSGNAVFNVRADRMLSAFNSFNGFAGTDRFNFDLNGAPPPSSANIDAGTAPANFRDTVKFFDSTPVARAARFDVSLAETTFRDLAAITSYTMQGVETILYEGDTAGVADQVILTTPSDRADDITVAPFDADKALIFLGGQPFETAPQNFLTRLPGVAGGGPGPDFKFANLGAPAPGLPALTLDAGGDTNNRLYVYGNSDVNLVNPASPAGFDIFEFGLAAPTNNVLIPARNAANYGAGAGVTAFDTITVSPFDPNTNLVTVANRDVTGNATPFVPFTFPIDQFVQSTNRIGVTINGGDESTTDPNGLADDITIPLSTVLRYQVNGNRPDVPGDTSPPRGDRLNFSARTVTVFSNQAPIPIVTFVPSGFYDAATEGPFFLPVVTSSIESFRITANVVNVLGDNGDQAPIVGQNDEFLITGVPDPSGFPATRAFNLAINGSGFITFNGVNTLNVQGRTGDDRIALQPFATPNQPWGIDTFVDGGVGTDRLAYTGADGQPDAIVVEANAAEAGRGRVFDPGIVTNNVNGIALNFINSERLNVNANPNDGDTLRVRGTTFNDTVLVHFDPTPLGTKPGNALLNGGVSVAPNDLVDSAGVPLVDLLLVGRFGISIDRGRGLLVRQAGGGPLAPDAPVANGFGALTLDLLEGDDTVNVNLVATAAGRPAVANGGGAGVLPLNLTINGGPSNIGDSIVLQGNLDLADSDAITPGIDRQSGNVLIGGTDTGTFGFNGIEGITVDGRGGTGADTVTVNGTAADNAFSLTRDPSGAQVGTLVTDATPTLTLTNLGRTGSAITLNGGSGNDSFSIEPLSYNQGGTPVRVGVTVVGGDLTANESDEVVLKGTSGADTVSLTPNATGGGTATLTAGATTFGDVALAGIESWTYDGLGGNDRLNINSPGAGTDVFVFTPGSARDSGLVRVNTLLPVRFVNLGVSGSVNAVDLAGGDGDQLVYQGTSGDDVFNVGPVGGVPVIGLTDAVGVHVNVGLSGIESVSIEAGAGADALIYAGSAASETLSIGSATGLGNRILISGGAAGPVQVSGLEHASLVGGGGDDTFAIGDLSLTGLTLVDASLGVGTDRVEVSGTATNDVVTASPAAGGLVNVAGLSTLVRIFGAALPDVLAILGLAGNDTLKADAGTEALIGVLLDGGGGDDFLSADATLIGGLGNDRLVGGFGNDSLVGGDGNDTLDGGIGDDTLLGGDGDDLFLIGDLGVGANVYDGGFGFDLLRLTGTEANDVIAYPIFDTITSIERFEFLGLGGNDIINIGGILNGVILIDGGPGNDTINLSFLDESKAVGPATLLGGDGNDTIYGSAFGDLIDAGAGDDWIYGSADIVPPTVLSTRDTIHGGDGNDVILGGAGDDLIFGGAGNDLLVWNNGSANDTIDGGDGYDVVRVDAVQPSGATGGYDFTIESVGPNVFVRRTNADPFRLDIIGTEQLDLNAQANTVAVTVNDLSATDLRLVNANPVGSGGDTVTVNGGPRNDVMTLSATDNFTDNVAAVTGMSATIRVLNITRADGLTLNGGLGDDSLTATAGSEAIFGSLLLTGDGGNDLLAGNTTLDGGDGDDSLTGGAGGNLLIGGAGNDTLTGLGGNDTLLGAEGDDTLDGGDGDDLLDAGAGSDSLLGGAGNDSLNSGDGNDTLDAGDGNDSLDAGAGNDSLLGGSGADILSGGAGEDVLDGGAGDDRLAGGDGTDRLLGGDGNDLIYGSLASADPAVASFALTNDSIDGGSGNDTLVGTGGANLIEAGDGDDLVLAYGGNDTVNAGAGNDTVFGGDGDDGLNGGDGNDLLDGAAGNDLLRGDAGNDLLFGGAGDDRLYGGFGNDSLYGNTGNDYLHGGDGVPNPIHRVRPLTPDDGNDLLIGGADRDQLDGGNGDNTLDAGFDGIRETLVAGSGDDRAYISHREDIPALDGGRNRVFRNRQLPELTAPAVPPPVAGARAGSPLPGVTPTRTPQPRPTRAARTRPEPTRSTPKPAKVSRPKPTTPQARNTPNPTPKPAAKPSKPARTAKPAARTPAKPVKPAEKPSASKPKPSNFRRVGSGNTGQPTTPKPAPQPDNTPIDITKPRGTIDPRWTKSFGS